MGCLFVLMAGIFPRLALFIVWVARPNLQWDVSAGHIFHGRDNDWFASAGITLRRPGGR